MTEALDRSHIEKRRISRLTPNCESPAIARLSSLASLTEDEMDILRVAEKSRQCVPPRGEIVVEGLPVREASIILSGWACRVRHFPDGRRQILGLLLPGDLLGLCRQRDPLAVTNIVALTEVILCPAPDATGRDGLAEAYAVSGALDEAYLFRQIARLGRLSAPERIADWLLEIRDRLTIARVADGSSLPMPITQEALADTLGLTSVHVNRTLQTMRRDQLIEWHGGMVRLPEPEALISLIDYSPVAVTRRRPAAGVSRRA
jgi:CRP-like cAMP-binding protein